MTVADQIKILDRKIKQNETQHDLDRDAAKISSWPSKNLPKYEHLTGGRFRIGTKHTWTS